MKVLNLYSGIGGNRKLWEDVEVTAIEINEEIAQIYQDFFPNDKVIIGDAHQYLLEHFKEFDFIWASPPCPTHSRLRFTQKNKEWFKPVYPDMKLYQEIILLDNYFEGKYVIENVKSFYKPLILPKESGRHYFWANFRIGKMDINSGCVSITKQSEKEKAIGISIQGYELKSIEDKRQLLSNCVEPEIGKYILNCARDIITSENVNQKELF